MKRDIAIIVFSGVAGLIAGGACLLWMAVFTCCLCDYRAEPLSRDGNKVIYTGELADTGEYCECTVHLTPQGDEE